VQGAAGPEHSTTRSTSNYALGSAPWTRRPGRDLAARLARLRSFVGKVEAAERRLDAVELIRRAVDGVWNSPRALRWAGARRHYELLDMLGGMPVYRVGPEKFEPLQETTFPLRGLKERADLQRLLRSSIGVVAPDVMVISEEFAEWDDSKRRIDLLGIDDNANLVVLELKRDDDGGHMELQAIRYAAMVSGMTFARAVDVYQAFLDKAEPGQDARAKLLGFLEWDEPREDDFARDVRIVLVAANFSKEVTTAVLWLNERDLDIRCVRLRPYANGDQTLIDAQQVVPLPEAEEYTIHIKQKGQAVRQEQADRHILRLAFWKDLIPAAANVTPRFARIAPSDNHWVSASAGVPGMEFSYLAWGTSAGVELYIDRGTGKELANKAIFDYLHERKAAIESVYGAPLSWRRLDEKRACRITEESIDGGVKSPRDEWHRIRSAMIDAMRRLEAALAPHLQAAVAAAPAKT
jgi:hypothetical protein